MNLKISRILHAGYQFDCEQTQILFDPIFENPFSINCHAFPDVKFDLNQIKQLKPKAIFISHFHDDHCSLESLNLLNRNTPIFVFCLYEELFQFIRELGFLNVYPLQIDVPVIVGPFEIIPRRALDSDIDSLFHIKVVGLNILNVVDSWIDSLTLEALALAGPWDMVLWPFQTMRELEVIAPSRSRPASGDLPPEWIEQLKKLNPKYVVPSSCQFIQESWSWYRYAFFPITYNQFAKEVSLALPDVNIIKLNPSVSISFNQGIVEPAKPLFWMQPIGEQNLDYEYIPDLKPPSTQEIAQHFAPLSREQTLRVYQYCETGLIEKYNSMEAPEDPYFQSPRVWRLSVYDHAGTVKHFLYNLNGQTINNQTTNNENTISIATENNEQLAWCTEVSIAKFYGALELGESLSSMYLRINDYVFSSEIEKEIQDVDIVEDPLLRCLFNGIFGAYQSAQLKRLKFL